MSATYQKITLIIGILLFVYCLIVILTEANLILPSALQTLSSAQIFAYMKQNKFSTIDIVLLPPFVQDGEKNLSVVSVLRFMPWFRRLHIYDPTYEPSKNVTEYWKTHEKSRLVFFHQDLLEYSMSTPFLDERFIILRPLFVPSNYTFKWQFFIDDSPVLRSCKTGLIPMTRSILNECSYQGNVTDKYAFAVRKGIEDRRIRYIDNHDHFIPPCSSSPVTTVKDIGAVYKPEVVRTLFQFEEIKKNRTARPAPLVLAVISSPKDDLTMILPSRYAANIQIWIHLTDLVDDTDSRLSLSYRMHVSRNIFIEIYMKGLNYNAEQIGAEIMRQIRTLSHQEEFKVLDVFSYKAGGGSFAQILANQVGNKLARTYTCPFTPFSETEQPVDNQEWQRLNHL